MVDLRNERLGPYRGDFQGEQRRRLVAPERRLQLPVAVPERCTQEKIFCPKGSAQAIEKARFRQANPRKSKENILLSFACFRPGLAGLG
jgi:hypothetical protein